LGFIIFKLIKDQKIFAYLHGGYWQWGSIDASCFMAENFVQQEIVVAPIGYNLAPNVTMTQIVEQVERSIAKILELSIDCDIYVCGHSAGGHLASILLNCDFETKYNSKNVNQIKAIIPVSGVFDLEPLIRTDINDNLKMNEQEARLLSPLLMNDCYLNKDIRVLLAYGEEDSIAFKEQSHDYKKHLKEKLRLLNVDCIQIDKVDHFNVIENLSRDDYQLTKVF
jgi:arylformamidase